MSVTNQLPIIFLPKRTYSFLHGHPEAIEALGRYFLTRDPSYKDHVTEGTAEELRIYHEAMKHVFLLDVYILDPSCKINKIQIDPTLQPSDDAESFFTVQKTREQLIVYIDENFISKSSNITDNVDLITDFYKQLAIQTHQDYSMEEIHRYSVMMFLKIKSNATFLTLMKFRLETFL